MFWDEFKSWYAQPFSADMKATGWIALIGLIMIGVIFWSFVLRHIAAGLEAIAED